MKLDEKLHMVRMSIQAVIKDYKTSRLITGTQGIGKSHSIIEELDMSEVNYIHIQGGIKDARTFFMTLTDNNDEDLIIVFDDVNTIFGNKDCREILRVACTNQPIRSITYTDSFLAKNKYKYPSPLDFASKIIVVTNVPKRKIDEGIISRTSAIEIIADKDEIMDYIWDNIEEAPPKDVDLKWKKEVYAYLKDEIGIVHIKQIDFRVFEDCVLWRCADTTEGSAEWRKLVHTVVT